MLTTSTTAETFDWAAYGLRVGHSWFTVRGTWNKGKLLKGGRGGEKVKNHCSSHKPLHILGDGHLKDSELNLKKVMMSQMRLFSGKCLQLCQVVRMSHAEAEELLNNSLLQSQIVSICLQLQLLLIRVVFILLPCHLPHTEIIFFIVYLISSGHSRSNNQTLRYSSHNSTLKEAILCGVVSLETTKKTITEKHFSQICILVSHAVLHFLISWPAESSSIHDYTLSW